MRHALFPTSLVLVIASCDSDDGAAAVAPAIVDIRADSNRDGEVRFDDSDGDDKTVWNASRGAVFLANIDDDNKRCPSNSSDLAMAECNDADNDVVDGEEDALDLAPLRTRPWPDAPPDATARVVVANYAARERVRLFKKTGPLPADYKPISGETVFTREEIAQGIELAIEGKDIVRDPEQWDGYVDVKWIVRSATYGQIADSVRLRVAPVLMYHHLLPAETIWIPNTNTAAHKVMHEQIRASCETAGLGSPSVLDVDDQWAQDYFEPAFMSMPAKHGAQHVIRVNYRSANVFNRAAEDAPLRPAGRIVFKLRGRDVAGVQQFDPQHSSTMDSLSSLGNFETVPPYERGDERFPFGRVLRGATKSFYPDRAFARMVEAQAQQPPIDVDTSWLLVGHVDETISFVKAPTLRGWMLLINDPRLAKTMLEDAAAQGYGDKTMFAGKHWLNLETGAITPAVTTINAVLADTQIMQASAEAAAEVDAQLDILKKEIGLKDREIIKVPFLHAIAFGKSVAYQPAMVNGLYVSETRFAAPDPHGPVIDGVDIFKDAFADSLRKIGITVDWVEDWDAYHRIYGEVHCGSNSTRKIPEVRWWESGR